MTHDEFDQAIFDELDGALAPETRAAMAAHELECAHCAETARQARMLDAALVQALSPEPLPAAFDARLRARLRGETRPMTAAERARRRAEAEAEYATGLAQLRRGWLDADALGEIIAYPVLAAAAGGLAWRLLGGWEQSGAFPMASQLLTPTLLGAISLVVGLTAVFPLLRRRQNFAL